MKLRTPLDGFDFNVKVQMWGDNYHKCDRNRLLGLREICHPPRRAFEFLGDSIPGLRSLCSLTRG